MIECKTGEIDDDSRKEKKRRRKRANKRSNQLSAKVVKFILCK